MNEYEMVGAFQALFAGEVDFNTWCDQVGIDKAMNYYAAGVDQSRGLPIHCTEWEPVANNK